MGTPKGTRPWNYGTSVGWVDARGYRWVYVTQDGRRRARREHRFIMEQHIGRPLEPWEVVHHKDNNPSNNDLSNLEIKEFGQHTADHNLGTRKSRETRRSMEAFALMRETLLHERMVRADLLEALKAIELQALQSPDLLATEYGQEALTQARAAILRATGGEGWARPFISPIATKATTRTAANTARRTARRVAK